MKPNHYIYTLILIPVLFLSSCDPEYCTYSRVVNETEHRVTLKGYYKIEVSPILLNPFSSTEDREYCNFGFSPNFSFFYIEHQPRADSLDVVFNDTLSLRYYNQCCGCVIRNPLDDGCFEPVPGQANTYAYRITGADYQQALELYPGK